ncbi:unnamed protein product, partial [Linum tenue]
DVILVVVAVVIVVAGVQGGEEEAVGEVRGGDKGLDEERGEGVAGDVRQRRAGGDGLRPGRIRRPGTHGGAQLPGGEGEGVAGRDELRRRRRRKSTCKKSKDRRPAPGKQLLGGAATTATAAAGQSNVVVLEDLGAEYLEELLRACTDNHR